MNASAGSRRADTESRKGREWNVAYQHELCRIRAVIRDLQHPAHLIADALDYEGSAAERAIELRKALGVVANAIEVRCCVQGDHARLDYAALDLASSESR